MMTVQVYNGRENQVNVRIPRIEADATVDGVINEPVWQQAALLTGFSGFSPHDGIPSRRFHSGSGLVLADRAVLRRPRI